QRVHRVQRRRSRGPRLDLRVPHLAQRGAGGIQALEPRVGATGTGLRLGPHGRLVREPTFREVRDGVVDGGQVLLGNAVTPVELLAFDAVRQRLGVRRVGVAVRHGEGGGGRVNDLHLGSVTTVNQLTGYAQDGI